MEQDINFHNKRWYKRWWGKVLIIMAVLFLAYAAYFAFTVLRYSSMIKSGDFDFVKEFSGSASELQGSEFDYTDDRDIIESSDDPWFGNPDAKVTVVEFSDYKCPMCRRMFPVTREIMNEYKDRVKFIYRDYPVISEDSLIYAQAAECADDQGKFWEMHDKLFINQDNLSEFYVTSTLVKQIGLDQERFEQCLKGEKYQKEIISDLYAARDLDVAGTPTFFINGFKISGVFSKDDFKLLLDAQLALQE